MKGRQRKARLVTPNSISSPHIRTRPRAGSKVVGRNKRGATTDEWYTPKWLIEALGNDFELDPCAPQSTWYTAAHCYTKADDGLSKDWERKYIFANPPYSAMEPWMEKIVAHQNGIALTFPRTDADWMQHNGLAAELVLFIDKRLKFVRGEQQPDGSLCVTKAKSAPAPSILLAYGDRAVRAVARAFLADTRLYGRLAKGFDPYEVYYDILRAPKDPATFAQWPDFDPDFEPPPWPPSGEDFES